ncbi:MAG: hypothetical protein AAFU79_00880 [Myxococcota bacterium]
MRSPTPLLLLLVTACASAGLKRIDDASLAEISTEQKTDLDRRAATHEEAKIALEEAERALAEANLVLDEQKYLRDRVEDNASANEDLRKQATSLSLDVRVRDYEAQSSNLKLRLEEANRHLQLARARRDYASAQVQLRTAEIQLADAAWEEAKASTLAASRPENPSAVNLSDFKSQVAGAHEDVASAQERSAKAWKKVEDRRKKHEVAVAQLPTTTEAERRAILAERDKDQLEGRVQRLEKRIRDLERENAGLMTRVTTAVTKTSTTAFR